MVTIKTVIMLVSVSASKSGATKEFLKICAYFIKNKKSRPKQKCECIIVRRKAKTNTIIFACKQIDVASMLDKDI